MHVIIVGAGWAGLSAAAELIRRDVQVTVIEAARHAGGRARTVPKNGHPLDNGQHLLLGAYRATLNLLATIGVTEADVLHRQPLHWAVRGTAGVALSLCLPRIPAPLHLLAGLARARGFTLTERVAALRLGAQLARALPAGPDISVAEWLRTAGQPPRLIQRLWEPLCLASLNTPIAYASSQIYARVLRDALTRGREDSDLLIPRVDLSRLLPDPAVAYIQRHGGEVIYGERVTALRVTNDRVVSVDTRGGAHHADHVILATAPSHAAPLMAPYAACGDIIRQIAELGSEPICTVYLRYAPGTALGAAMEGLMDCAGQWVFDLGHRGEPGLMAVVISGPGPHMAWRNDVLGTRIQRELAARYPRWPAPFDIHVIREKRATFSCRAGIQAYRPHNRTPLSGLWLAGDYTATPYPATLEGAVLSGVACVEALTGIENRTRP